MRYVRNEAGNRIVDATPEETRALRPAIAAAFRRWRANEADIPDFCQEVEVIVWRAVEDRRIPGDGFRRPVNALLDFMFAVGWNLWRNHSRRRSVRNELLHDVMPDMVGPSPEARLDARETLYRIGTHPDIARVLLAPLDGPYPERREGLPHTTYWSRVSAARKWARKPRMPDPPTPWKRKKRR